MGASLLMTMLPILVACGVSLVLTAAATAAARDRAWLSGLPAAAALAAAAVAWAIIYPMSWGNGNLQSRLAFIPTGAAILFALISGGEGRAQALVNGLLALVVAGASVHLLFGRRPDLLPLGIGTLSLVIGALAGLLAWRAEAGLQRLGPAFARLVVGIAMGAAAAALPAMGDIRYGISAGALAAALGLPIVLALWRGTSAGIAAAAVCGLAPLLLVDYALADLQRPALTVVPTAMLIALALLSGHVGRLPGLCDKPLKAGWIAVAVCVVLAGSGLGWAALHGVDRHRLLSGQGLDPAHATGDVGGSTVMRVTAPRLARCASVRNNPRDSHRLPPCATMRGDSTTLLVASRARVPRSSRARMPCTRHTSLRCARAAACASRVRTVYVLVGTPAAGLLVACRPPASSAARRRPASTSPSWMRPALRGSCMSAAAAARVWAASSRMVRRPSPRCSSRPPAPPSPAPRPPLRPSPPRPARCAGCPTPTTPA